MDSFRIYQAWERIPCWNVDENTFHLPLLPVAVHNWHFIEIQKFRSIRNFWQMQHRSFLELAAAASCENFSQDLHQVQYQCRSKAETRWWHGIKVVEFDAKISSQWFQLANLHFQCGPSSKRILAKFGVTSFRFMMVLARLVSVCTSPHWSENQCTSTCFMNIPTLMSKDLLFF